MLNFLLFKNAVLLSERISVAGELAVGVEDVVID
jgi:hypothetical protein